MQWKLVSAFATGAVLASGIVYFAVKPQEVAKLEAPKPISAPVATPQVVAVPPRTSCGSTASHARAATGSRKTIADAAASAPAEGSQASCDRSQ